MTAPTDSSPGTDLPRAAGTSAATHPDTRVPDTLPNTEPSTLALPISVGSEYLERALDQVLDKLQDEPGLLYQHEDIDIGGGLTGIAQVWRRGNTHIAMNNDAIVATLPVRVQLKPSWKPGIAGLSLPFDIHLPLDISAEYTVRLRSQPHLDADYNLRLDATFEYSVDRPVGIEAVGVDVGITFGGTSRRAAEDALNSLCNWLNDEHFHYLNFRDQVARAWAALQQPVNLSPGYQVRLEIVPEAVYALPFYTQADMGFIGLAVVAHIHALTSTDAHIVMAPLPAISPGIPASGVTLSLPFAMSFAALKDALREHIADHPWQLDGRHVVLRDVDVAGNDDGELRVRVEISVTSDHGGFEFEASLSASGMPNLDSARQHLSLENFRYDAHTDSRLLNIAASLLRPFAGKLLEPWLEMPLDPHAQRLLYEANTRLGEGIVLAEGVTLSGKAVGVRLTHLSANAHGLALQVESHGELSIRIDHPA